MKVALISMQGGEVPKKIAESIKKRTNLDDNLFWADRQRYDEAEITQTLGLALHMRDSGKLEPLIICLEGSTLAHKADKLDLPRITLKKGKGIADYFHLWQWQKLFDKLIILVIGESGITVGKRLFKIRKKGTSQLNFSFLIRTPDKYYCKNSSLHGVKHILCGSGYIAQYMDDICSEAKIKMERPEIIAVMPGIDLKDFKFPPIPYKDKQSSPHFVFGMAESLMPRSGALLVIRAMSALWQQSDIPHWEVRMFGGGPRYKEIMEEADKLGVLSRLCILPEQPLGEVSHLCHVWIAPSISPVELPQTLWAGFASGLPVICVKTNLHEERLSCDNKTTIEVMENNPQKMASAMLNLLRDAQLRKNLAEAGSMLRPEISQEGMASRASAIMESWIAEMME